MKNLSETIVRFLILACALGIVLATMPGCQTVSNAREAFSEWIAPTSGGTVKPIHYNPWPVGGVLLFVAGAGYGSIFRDWRTGIGIMAAGVVMGAVGLAFDHPWAPWLSLVLVFLGIVLKINKHFPLIGSKKCLKESHQP